MEVISKRMVVKTTLGAAEMVQGRASEGRQKLGSSLKEGSERKNPVKIYKGRKATGRIRRVTLLPAHLHTVSAQCSVWHSAGSEERAL